MEEKWLRKLGNFPTKTMKSKCFIRCFWSWSTLYGLKSIWNENKCLRKFPCIRSHLGTDSFFGQVDHFVLSIVKEYLNEIVCFQNFPCVCSLSSSIHPFEPKKMIRAGTDSSSSYYIFRKYLIELKIAETLLCCSFLFFLYKCYSFIGNSFRILNIKFGLTLHGKNLWNWSELLSSVGKRTKILNAVSGSKMIFNCHSFRFILS